MGKFFAHPGQQVDPYWHKVYHYYQHRGDILSSFQLIYLNVISIFSR